MKLSVKTQKIFKFLQEWQNEFRFYDLMHFHNMELYNELEKEAYLENMWDIDLTKYFDDKFYSLATEGGTGYFAFWHYKNLQGEAPIVLLTNSGCEVVFLAGNLNDLVCRMIHRIGFNGGWSEETKEDFEDIYYQITDRYEEEYKKEISIEKAKVLVEEERQIFKERALKLIDFISEEEIENNIKKHPCFVDRVEQFDFKNTEFYYLKHEIENEEDLKKLLNIFRNQIKSEFYSITKEQVTAGLKGNYPNYYKSLVFQNWLKDVDKSYTDDELKARKAMTEYTSLYLNGKIVGSFLEGFEEKYPEILKQPDVQDWIKKAKEQNLDAILTGIKK